MNILFLTLSQIRNVEEPGLYTDLIRCFRDRGHNVYIVNPCERRYHLPTNLKEDHGVHILSVRTMNIQKTSFIEKGLSYVFLDSMFMRAIRRNYRNLHFDLVIYTTPPNSYSKVVSYLKKSGTHSYMLQKDFFIQGCVDLGAFSKNSLFYKYFRRKEKKLFHLSDYIGCMSPANVKFLLNNNPEIPEDRVEVCPNSIQVREHKLIQSEERNSILEKYNIPNDKPLFIYGGNIGIPQGIDFVIKVLQSNIKREDIFFILVGNGTELPKLMQWYEKEQPKNVLVRSALPKVDYDMLVNTADVGMVFLKHNFIVPNFPSRLLTYLEYSMPVLVATDKSSDMGKIAEENGFGLWSYSNDVDAFNKNLDFLMSHREMWKKMGEKGHKFLVENYTVEKGYEIIMSHFRD